MAKYTQLVRSRGMGKPVALVSIAQGVGQVDGGKGIQDGLGKGGWLWLPNSGGRPGHVSDIQKQVSG